MAYFTSDVDKEDKAEPSKRFQLSFTEEFLSKYLFEGAKIQHVDHNHSRGIITFYMENGRWEVYEGAESPEDTRISEKLVKRLTSDEEPLG